MLLFLFSGEPTRTYLFCLACMQSPSASFVSSFCDTGDNSVDAAIFCLALMGTDYSSFVAEACRVLRMGGLLWIAEVRSRFADSSKADQGSKDVFESFVAALKKLGLQVTKQDSSNTMFVVFEAKKVAERRNVTVQWPELKPCMYKRR